jgi:hypothetical protein
MLRNVLFLFLFLTLLGCRYTVLNPPPAMPEDAAATGHTTWTDECLDRGHRQFPGQELKVEATPVVDLSIYAYRASAKGIRLSTKSTKDVPSPMQINPDQIRLGSVIGRLRLRTPNPVTPEKLRILPSGIDLVFTRIEWQPTSPEDWESQRLQLTLREQRRDRMVLYTLRPFDDAATFDDRLRYLFGDKDASLYPLAGLSQARFPEFDRNSLGGLIISTFLPHLEGDLWWSTEMVQLATANYTSLGCVPVEEAGPPPPLTNAILF